MNDDSRSTFMASLFPEHVLNSQGVKEPFDIGDIQRKLRVQTGLDEDISREISDAVLLKILEVPGTLTTDKIKGLVRGELVLRGLDKFKDMFNLDMKRFWLDESFLDTYRGKQPDWGEVGYITYKRTYSRLKDDGSKEEFWETLKRVVEGCYSIQKTHCNSLEIPWDEEKAQRSAQRMFEKAWNFKFLPPGRGLWIMGTDFVRRHGSMALNNCAFISTKNLKYLKTRPFEFMMDCSMLGVGVGFDTKGAGTLEITNPEGKTEFDVPDSREGWVESLSLLLNAFFNGGALPEFNYDLIRPAGAPIHGFGGTASGPGPLIDMHRSIENLLMDRVGKSITSVDIVDIMNLIARCVVAGNVRRSAQIALGSDDDESYITMKDPDLYSTELSDRRWASNNSVIIDPEEGHDYSDVASSIAKNGEPGIVWLDNARKYSRMIDPPDWKDKNVAGVNPCGEQSLESGELCCLVETFPSRHDDYGEYEETLKYAYLYAKSVTLMRTHRKDANAVMLKNRRIGTSMSGIIDAFNRHGRREVLKWCDKGYRFLQELDADYSDWLCIPRSLKITTVKPSGTTSLLPGVSPGIHYPHSEYYIRRIRISRDSELIPRLMAGGYKVEASRSGSKSTLVVEFPIRTKDFKVGKRDVSMEMQVMNAIDMQKYWSDNQVSITVSFKPEEASRINDLLQACEDKLKGISFLPLLDHGYEQAPYEEITKEQYERMLANIKEIDLHDYGGEAKGVRGCDSDHCTI